MASTNWDTDRKRHMPPAWDPPKLLLVAVSGLHVVVGTFQRSRSHHRRWRLAPGLQHLVATTRKKGKGKRGRKATVSTHPKYSQARSYTTYVRIGIKWNKGIICGLNCRMPE